ncbi:aldo/keto reductase [Nitrincola sp. MINF-07-Sa-05]|uniref:aldo/keto reductase n=1 Tax=Nitrincola salilacus TaxID=3400273 RepID=UPI003917E915
MRTRTIDISGTPICELGFGAAGIGNLYRPMESAMALDVVADAWRQGVRYFDTAPHYGAGLSERRLGLALQELPREAQLLSTKVGRVLEPLPSNVPVDGEGFVQAAPFARRYDYSYDGVMRSFEDSLQRLGVGRIDILLMHDIGRLTHGDQHELQFRTAMDSGYRAMAELREQGLVKAIGLGVNEWQVCDEAMNHGDFDCFMVANCFTLLENSITDTFTERCRHERVSLIVAAPFNSGVLAKGSVGAGHYFYGDVPAEVIERVKVLEAVCGQYDIPLAAAAIQYPLRYDCVKSVVIGMTKGVRIRQNIDWYALPIPSEFWQALVDKGCIGAFPGA